MDAWGAGARATSVVAVAMSGSARRTRCGLPLSATAPGAGGGPARTKPSMLGGNARGQRVGPGLDPKVQLRPVGVAAGEGACALGPRGAALDAGDARCAQATSADASLIVLCASAARHLEP
jgi:hypothetical protein